MRRRTRVGRMPGLVCAALILGLVTGLVACGAPPASGTDGLRTARGATPASTAPSAISATPTSASAPGSPAGAVILVLDRFSYASTDTILVTIRNGLSTAIYADTNHTDCELVTLERLINDVWQVASTCSGAFPAARLEQIAPGGALDQVLAAHKPGPTGISVGASWPSGTYRIALVYVTSAAQPLNHGSAVYSRSFTVG